MRFERVKGTDTDEDEEAALAGGRRQNEGGGGDQARSSDQGGGEPEGGTAAASAEFKSAGPVSEAPAPAQSHGSDRGLEMHEMAGTQARWAGSAGGAAAASGGWVRPQGGPRVTRPLPSPLHVPPAQTWKR